MRLMCPKIPGPPTFSYSGLSFPKKKQKEKIKSKKKRKKEKLKVPRQGLERLRFTFPSELETDAFWLTLTAFKG
jgi:hypothetical protein